MLARWLEFIEQGMRATEREAVVSSEGERERRSEADGIQLLSTRGRARLGGGGGGYRRRSRSSAALGLGERLALVRHMLGSRVVDRDWSVVHGDRGARAVV